MAIQSQPSRISEPFAGSGTKNAIPATNATPSASQAASWASGFPPECSQPISAGGCPVPRNDMNGVLNQISQDFAFRQDGGVWEWSAQADYDTQRIVRGSDGILYRSIAQSGPGVAAGAQDPTADTSHAYWSSPAVPTMPNTDSSSAAASTAWVNLWADDALRPAADYYVDAVNGDDANDGLTAATAKKTISSAVSVVESAYALRPAGTAIHIAAGSYASPVTVSLPNLVISFVGPSSGIAEVPGLFFQNCQNASIEIGGRFRVTAGGLYVARGAKVLLSNGLYVNFHDLGSTTYAISLYREGMVSMANNTSVSFEFTGTNTFSAGTVSVVDLSLFQVFGSGVTFSGTVTGPRYDVRRGSGISGTGSTTLISGSTIVNPDATSFYN